MDILIVVDMQIGLLSGTPKHDLCSVIERINSLAGVLRDRRGKVLWIRHCGGAGDDFEPHTPGWDFLPELTRHRDDVTVEKTLNDPFANTLLKSTLDQLAPERLFVTGWATDFCVDATVRSAVSNNHDVVVVSDAHTLSDRPHLDAPTIIRHHNWVWSELITNRSVRLATSQELLEERGTAELNT